MYQDMKYINGIIYYEEKDGKYYPIKPPIMSSVGGGGGLSKSQVINLINQFSGGGLAPSYQATATDDITTQSDTDVVATGMTLTPPAGTYLVWFSGSANNTNTNNNATVFTSIYSNNSQVSSSEERSGVSGGMVSLPPNLDFPFNCVAKVTVDGSQTIEGRWRISDTNETATMHQRNITALKVSL